MAHEAGPGVEARGLIKTFGRVTAVGEMSFTAPAGKVTDFLGPSGVTGTARLPPRWGGGLVLAGYAAAFATAAIVTTLSRDVT
jgi:hypothetical protein